MNTYPFSLSFHISLFSTVTANIKRWPKTDPWGTWWEISSEDILNNLNLAHVTSQEAGSPW